MGVGGSFVAVGGGGSTVDVAVVSMGVAVASAVGGSAVGGLVGAMVGGWLVGAMVGGAVANPATGCGSGVVVAPDWSANIPIPPTAAISTRTIRPMIREDRRLSGPTRAGSRVVLVFILLVLGREDLVVAPCTWTVPTGTEAPESV